MATREPQNRWCGLEIFDFQGLGCFNQLFLNWFFDLATPSLSKEDAKREKNCKKKKRKQCRCQSTIKKATECNANGLAKLINRFLEEFLAATSSSRSDDVTPFVCLFVCHLIFFRCQLYTFAPLNLCNVHSTMYIVQCA